MQAKVMWLRMCTYKKFTYAFQKLIRLPSANNEMMLNSIMAPKEDQQITYLNCFVQKGK